MTKALKLWKKLAAKPGGKWLFTKAINKKAPYFGSMGPSVQEIDECHAVVTIEHKRKVQNHIGTVHAIALCNMAELAMGMVAEATVPGHMRWLPKAMSVNYVAKANGKMTATATAEQPKWEGKFDWPINVSVTDPNGTEVFNAVITTYISPKK